jgi:hypothetical protein
VAAQCAMQMICLRCGQGSSAFIEKTSGAPPSLSESQVTSGRKSAWSFARDQTVIGDARRGQDIVAV